MWGWHRVCLFWAPLGPLSCQQDPSVQRLLDKPKSSHNGQGRILQTEG